MKIARYSSDFKQRKVFRLSEIYKTVLQFILLYLKKISQVLCFVIIKLLHKHLCNFSYVCRIKNYCIVTGRSRSVYRHFKVSRIHLRYLGSEGLFFGLKKAS